jgi:hypothetical protein
MVAKLLLAFTIMAICVAIHSMGLLAILRWVRVRMMRGARGFGPSAWRLIRVAAATILLHLGQVLAWATAYALGGAMPDFTTAAYFSAVTYTTTGYGDLLLPQDWRLVGGVEALTGILMCGLSTGMFFAVFSEIFGLKPRNT